MIQGKKPKKFPPHCFTSINEFVPVTMSTIGIMWVFPKAIVLATKPGIDTEDVIILLHCK